jgi:addiction module RelE/StbE family toxin
MHIGYSRQFKKMYKKLPSNAQRTFDAKLRLFFKDTKHPLLKIHKLHGKYRSLYSMNITADIRAVFEKVGKEHIQFIAIGSYSKLYS